MELIVSQCGSTIDALLTGRLNSCYILEADNAQLWFSVCGGDIKKGLHVYHYRLCLVSAMTTVYIRETHIHSSLNFIQAGPFPFLPSYTPGFSLCSGDKNPRFFAPKVS